MCVLLPMLLHTGITIAACQVQRSTTPRSAPGICDLDRRSTQALQHGWVGLVPPKKCAGSGTKGFASICFNLPVFFSA
jgi:hypothetical protein